MKITSFLLHPVLERVILIFCSIYVGVCIPIFATRIAHCRNIGDTKLEASIRQAFVCIESLYGSGAFQRGFKHLKKISDDCYVFAFEGIAETDLCIKVDLSTDQCDVKCEKIKYQDGDGLAKAIKKAESAIDMKYGSNAFVLGMRRVLRDEDRGLYTFQVKARTGNTFTNLLVNVDLKSTSSVIKIVNADESILNDKAGSCVEM